MNPGFLWIISYGRSGSTLLQNMLNQLPAVLIRGENYGALMHLFRAVSAVSRARDEYGNRATEPTHPWFGAGAIDVEGFDQRLRELFVRDVIAPAGGEEIIGLKEVRFRPGEISAAEFTFMCDWLLTWRDARIIFNIRNHDDVCNSGWWRNKDPNEVKSLLEEIESRFRRYCELRPNRTFVWSYDAFIKSRSADNLADFLGVAPPSDWAENALRVRVAHNPKIK